MPPAKRICAGQRCITKTQRPDGPQGEGGPSAPPSPARLLARFTSVTSLAEASLSAIERRVLARFVQLVGAEFGDDLRAVWLYGSRARGETPGPESDVDVLVVSERAGWDERLRVIELVDQAAKAEGANPAFFAVHLYDPAHVSQRRSIDSFFFQEVDRDKIVLVGEP
jgi:predicted nucleotidyltransferase